MMKKRVPARDNLPETFGRIPVRDPFCGFYPLVRLSSLFYGNNID